MCNRMCDTVLFFLYAHLENKIITSNLPPPQHTYTLPPSACPVVAKGALAASPPPLIRI